MSQYPVELCSSKQSLSKIQPKIPAILLSKSPSGNFAGNSFCKKKVHKKVIIIETRTSKTDSTTTNKPFAQPSKSSSSSRPINLHHRPRSAQKIIVGYPSAPNSKSITTKGIFQKYLTIRSLSLVKNASEIRTLSTRKCNNKADEYLCSQISKKDKDCDIEERPFCKRNWPQDKELCQPPLAEPDRSPPGWPVEACNPYIHCKYNENLERTKFVGRPTPRNPLGLMSPEVYARARWTASQTKRGKNKAKKQRLHSSACRNKYPVEKKKCRRW